VSIGQLRRSQKSGARGDPERNRGRNRRRGRAHRRSQRHRRAHRARGAFHPRRAAAAHRLERAERDAAADGRAHLVVGRRESKLLYQSGLQFTNVDEQAHGVITSIIKWAAPAEEKSAAKPAISFDDSWVRQVNDFLQRDPEDDLPFAQFRLTASGWVKEYVGSPEQPADGFTLARGDTDFAELQKTWEYADPETRRMMQIALESKLVPR
jgi:hypothetical protein